MPATAADDFAAAMARLGPFEPRPQLAVACSGGPDSLALALLADAWARGRGGTASALIVDHRLRPGSGAEAAATQALLAGRGIPARVLSRRGPAPASAIQAAAREARYALLAAACRRAGILHLLLGHQRDDQAETVLFRAERGSGPDGLAGMAPLARRDGVRLLRPLLDVPRIDLAAVVAAAGLTALDDPANRDERFARTGLRRRLDGPACRRLAAAAAGAAAIRRQGDAACEALLARLVRPAAAGYALVDRDGWRNAADSVTPRALARLLCCIGGGRYPPAAAAVAALDRRMRQGAPAAGHTLAGCRVVAAGGDWLIAREAGRLPPAVPVQPGEPVRWDRFEARLPAGSGTGWRLGSLGAAGWRAVRQRAVAPPPWPVPPTLPALWRDGSDLPVAVPHLGLAGPVPGFRPAFRPRRPLAAGTQHVA